MVKALEFENQDTPARETISTWTSILFLSVPQRYAYKLRLAHLVELLTTDQWVGGSNPPMMHLKHFTLERTFYSLPVPLDFTYMQLAHLVERQSHTLKVGGSNPPLQTIKSGFYLNRQYFL